MEITSIRMRYIQGNHIFGIASITLDDQLIINDIKIFRINKEYEIRLPNSEYAQKHNQYNIILNKELFESVKSKIVNEIIYHKITACKEELK